MSYVLHILINGTMVHVKPVFKLMLAIRTMVTERRPKSSHFVAEPDTPELETLLLRNAHVPGVTCHIPIVVELTQDQKASGMLILGKGGRIIFDEELKGHIEEFNKKAMVLNQKWLENLADQVAKAKTMAQKGKAGTEALKLMPSQGVVNIDPKDLWTLLRKELIEKPELIEEMLKRPESNEPKGDYDQNI